MARAGSKYSIPGLFVLGVLCLGIGCFVRFKAWQADGKLRSWARVPATVLALEPFEARAGRYGTKTRFATTVRYNTPAGPSERRLVLSDRPVSAEIGVYIDPSDTERPPEPEQYLRSVTSTSNVTVANLFMATGAIICGTAAYAARRRRQAPLRGTTPTHFQ